MKPFIKYAGGKTQLLPEIQQRLPKTFNTYFEPFLGGGAVLLALALPTAIVNDINPELINLWRQVKEHVETLIIELSKLDASHEAASDAKGFYYKTREAFNEEAGRDTTIQAARFIYLNKHCFNGLYRVNSKGKFNVPFNGRLQGKSYSAEELRKASVQLKHVDFKLGDFDEALTKAKEKDFVFLDSPYAPLTPTSFLDYTKEGFLYEDHIRLAEAFKELTNRGVYCMLTNHDTTFVRELYKDYKIEAVSVRRSINSKGTNRTGIEVIITNY